MLATLLSPQGDRLVTGQGPGWVAASQRHACEQPAEQAMTLSRLAWDSGASETAMQSGGWEEKRGEFSLESGSRPGQDGEYVSLHLGERPLQPHRSPAGGPQPEADVGTGQLGGGPSLFPSLPPGIPEARRPGCRATEGPPASLLLLGSMRHQGQLPGGQLQLPGAIYWR